jgi:putative glycosyltransferase (TIGR04372 family)
MGDQSMRPLHSTPQVFDYALSPLKSDWLDVYLCASCRFFLGDTSGLFNVAGAFGRKSVLTNTAPLISAFSPFPGDLAIPKQMFRDGRPLTFAEGFSPEIGRLRLAPEFEKANISFVNNSKEEIANLVREAFDILEGNLIYTTEDELLQSHLHALVQRGQYCWPPSSRIGREYLRSRASELMGYNGRDVGSFLEEHR